MSELIATLLENEEIQDVLSENEQIIEEAADSVHNFNKVLKSFVLANPEEFIGESLDETFKNIRVFAEVATSQYLTEMSELSSSNLEIPEPIEEESIDSYL